MKLTEVEYPEGLPVDGYGPGFFRVGGQVVQGGMRILSGAPASWSGFDDADPLLDAAGDLDVLLVGTGGTLTPLPAAFRAAMEDAGIGVENMASPTACRTYNVLLSEGRRVGLAVLPV